MDKEERWMIMKETNRGEQSGGEEESLTVQLVAVSWRKKKERKERVMRR